MEFGLQPCLVVVFVEIAEIDFPNFCGVTKNHRRILDNVRYFSHI